MSRAGRRLSSEEAALWAKVARTVAPLDARAVADKPAADVLPASQRPVVARPALTNAPASPAVRISSPERQLDAHGLDAGWDRKLARGLVQPDFTLDLHGCTLDQAHGRLLHGLTQAKAVGARLVLLVTGKQRQADAADRGHQRGAIRAKAIDWLAASEHAHDIATIRGAHRRHGGPGALYVVLRRRR